MKVLGYSREDLLRRCNPSVLYGARRMRLEQGQGLVEVKTAAGLRFTLLEDKCLDILELEYKGNNLGFLSKNGLVNENNPETDSFTRYWQGGFLSTCGLRNMGPACSIDGEFFPLHGRIGTMPAEPVNVCVNEELISISGIVRESAMFGHCLELHRNIEVPSDGAVLTVKDVLYNLTPEPEHIFMLYHINFGFPFLSEALSAKFPEGEVRGRTPEAQSVIDSHTVFSAPIDGESEHVFFHIPKEERPKVTLTNKQLGISAEISYSAKQLPVLAQWKCMKSGDYALGIEPSTNFIHGRDKELEKGYDVVIPGFGTLEYGFSLRLGGL